jgi:hypothetical protein
LEAERGLLRASSITEAECGEVEAERGLLLAADLEAAGFKEAEAADRGAALPLELEAMVVEVVFLRAIRWSESQR